MNQTPQSSPELTDPRLLQLAPEDNVAVARRTIAAGEQILIAGQMVCLSGEIPVGHKLAVRHIAAGQKIIKYGAPIGSATRDIACGEHVHTHNIASDYLPAYTQRGLIAQ
jgi:altronate dehydratase small subunit